jgi:RNA polymerase sigma-70 factor (ECF subfamily)
MSDQNRNNPFIREQQTLNPSKPGLTIMLKAWSNGDRGALEKLTPLVYQELHRLARSYMARERPGHVLQVSALINEAYLRLIDWQHVQWKNRAHFFGVAAGLMRHILVDLARSETSAKRGGRPRAAPLTEPAAVSRDASNAVVAVHEALDRLAVFDARKAQVVEMRFFGGLTTEETAAVLGISLSTVENDWRLAKAWLKGELSHESNRR